MEGVGGGCAGPIHSSVTLRLLFRKESPLFSDEFYHRRPVVARREVFPIQQGPIECPCWTLKYRIGLVNSMLSCARGGTQVGTQVIRVGTFEGRQEEGTRYLREGLVATATCPR
jgi:hypothetical protein